MVVPGPVTSALHSGAHEELRVEGTILVARTDHVVEAVGRIGVDLAPVPHARPTPRDALTELQRQVLDGVRPRKILTAEQLAAVVGVPASDVRSAMPALERCYGQLIADLTERVGDGDDSLDNDFAVQEFLDRFGMRLAQLGTILNLVAPLAEVGPSSEG